VRLRFTPRAADDLAAIGDYVRSKNPAAAVRVRTAILESLRKLSLFPYMGRRQTLEDGRKIVTRRYPYLVYYSVDVDSIQHPARQREYQDT
jgi:toxin ParE1/3/4